MRGEEPKADNPSLATDSRSEKHLIHKLRGYNKIGQYFGAYANVFGLRHDFDVPEDIHPAPYNDDEYILELHKIRQLVEAGASRDAIAALLSAGGRHSVTRRHGLAIAVVCQKYGFIGPSFKALNLIKLSTSEDQLEKRLVARAHVVRLKLFMQIGGFEEAKSIAEELRLDVNILNSIDQLGAFHRRTAILSGWLGHGGGRF